MSLIKPSIILYKKLLVQSLQTQQHKENGFTLIELLVAMLILTIVLGMTGTGLVFIMNTNTKSDRQITQQSNLRRAADFIADEIKSASVVSQTFPTSWSDVIFPTASFSAEKVYLEITTPIENSPSGTTLTVENHGLIKGNAVRFSGNNLPAGMTSSITYYVKTPTFTSLSNNPTATELADFTNNFTVADSSGNNVSFSGSNPSNFKVSRLVAYYTVTANATTDKGIKALYRATGNCAASSNISEPTNCLTLIDSLASSSAFTITLAGQQATIKLNGQLCTPPSMANNDCTVTPTNVSMIAFSRATLK